MNNYVEFTNKFHEISRKYQELFQEEVEGMKVSIREAFKHNSAQFERAKRDFELTLAPLFLHELNEKLNSTWFNNLKRQVDNLKKSIDSHIEDFTPKPTKKLRAL